MARIIGEAAVRLRADSKGLAAEMRVVISRALKEASVGIGDGPTDGVTDGVRRDADKTSKSVRKILTGIAGHGQAVAASLASAVTSGARLALIGTKAGLALAAVTSLVTGIVGLVGVLGQAAGAAGILPAAFLAIQAATATVKLGLTGMSDAFAAVASGDAAALQESLKNLAPSARAFVLEVQKVKPAFDAMRLDVQQQLFKGLASSIQPLASRYLPIAREMFTGIAETASRAGRSVATFALEADTVGRVKTLTSNITGAFRELVPAIKPALSAFLDIGTVGSSFLPGIADKISAIAIKFGDFIRAAADSGQLAAFFQNAIDVIGQLFTVIKNVGAILGHIFQTAEQAGGGFLQSLVDITGSMRTFVESSEGTNALFGFFTSMRDIIGAILPIILQLAGVIGTSLAPILADLARTIGPAFAPIVDALGPALEAARPGIQALATGLASLLRAAAPLIGIVGQLAASFGRVLGKVFESLAPVITEVASVLGDQLAKVLPQLEPILIKVAEAVGQIFTALTPLIPVFFQLLTAILPILPPLLQLVQTIIPPLVSIVTALVPIVVALADVLAAVLPPIIAVATVILNILLPPIKLIAEVFSAVATAVAATVGFISDVIMAVFTGIGAFIDGFWSGLKDLFFGAVIGIADFVRGGFESIKNTIIGIVTRMRDSISNGIQGIIGYFRDLPGNILGFLRGLAGDAFNAGKDIVLGIIRGLGNLATAIKDKIFGLVEDAWNAVLDFFGISSPSKRAIKAFEEVGRGMIVGMDRIGPSVATAATDLSAVAMAGLQSPLDAGLSLAGLTGRAGGVASVQPGGGLVLHQTNVMAAGADIAQFSSEVTRDLAQRLAAGTSALPVSQGRIQRGVAAPGYVSNMSGV